MQNIEIVRGTTNILSLSVTDENGNPYNMQSGEIIRFGVKKKPQYEEYVIEKEITTCQNGVCSVVLAPSDTANIPFGKYVYDVGLQSGENYYPVIELSEFHIKPNVTKWGVV